MRESQVTSTELAKESGGPWSGVAVAEGSTLAVGLGKNNASHLHL